MGNKTLAILKPDCVRKNLIGQVISIITESGFKIKAMKMVRLTKNSAAGFYEIHSHQPWFNSLLEYMTSGACVPIALEKENAIEDYRKLIGSTDPAQADEGTVRKLYGESKSFNAVHGSDSVENGLIEIGFFFSKSEIVLCS